MKPAFIPAMQAPLIGALLAAGMVATAKPGAAHNPIFTPGPHLVYGGGIEVGVGYSRKRSSGGGERETEQEIEFEIEYGLTADWSAEMELPFVDKELNGSGPSGLGDVVLRSRYRVPRLDTPGVQRSAAVLAPPTMLCSRFSRASVRVRQSR